MKIIQFMIVFSIILTSCQNKNKVETEVEKIEVKLKVERFEQQFFNATAADLPRLKKKYPYLFPAKNHDSVWTNKMKNPLWRQLYTEVDARYHDFSPVQTKLETLLQHLKYYYPKTKNPKIITLISEMDYNAKSIYADSLVLISLELYLGKNHKFYQNEFPDYLKQNFEENQILPDLVSSFAIQKIPPPQDKTLLSLMIYAGKELYLKDKLLPETLDEEKIGYTKPQLEWCFVNESYMWQYFMKENLLYDTDSKLANRFINPAPFSKFYLEIDNDSPGKTGAWLGWQIVRNYMNNNNLSLQEMLKLDAKELFDNAHYKPSK